MKRKNFLTKNFLVSGAATFAIIGAGTILFNMATQTVMASGFEEVETVPTSYQVLSDSAVTLPESETKSEDGENVNYQVSMDSLNTGRPTEADLTMEEAAMAGGQYLKNIFGLDLKGAYVYMMYNPGTETFKRAFWAGDVLFEEAQTPESTRWTFMIDAVTGELFNISHSRQLDVTLSLGPDAALEKDYGTYAQLARKHVERCGLIDGPIDRVEYGCQGYAGNDPDITVDVIGENGKVVIMSFSRYDQALLGIITDTSLKISESSMEDAVGEVESMEFGSEKVESMKTD